MGAPMPLVRGIWSLFFLIKGFWGLAHVRILLMYCISCPLCCKFFVSIKHILGVDGWPMHQRLYFWVCLVVLWWQNSFFFFFSLYLSSLSSSCPRCLNAVTANLTNHKILNLNIRNKEENMRRYCFLTSSDSVTTYGGLKIKTSTFPKMRGTMHSTLKIKHSRNIVIVMWR